MFIRSNHGLVEFDDDNDKAELCVPISVIKIAKRLFEMRFPTDRQTDRHAHTHVPMEILPSLVLDNFKKN